MNFLAHALLAGNQEDLIVGAFLGDFQYGKPSGPYAEGVRLHRAIDRYSDAHPVFIRSKRLFEPPFRRYAGILVDVYYDHALARAWVRFCEESLDAFAGRMYDILDRHTAYLPDDLNRFAGYLAKHNMLAGYAEPEMIDQVLAGVSKRFSRANPLHLSRPQRLLHDDQLKSDFEEFFPDLKAHVASHPNDVVNQQDLSSAAATGNSSTTTGS